VVSAGRSGREGEREREPGLVLVVVVVVLISSGLALSLFTATRRARHGRRILLPARPPRPLQRRPLWRCALFSSSSPTSSPPPPLTSLTPRPVHRAGNSDWALYTLVGSGFTSELKFTAQGPSLPSPLHLGVIPHHPAHSSSAHRLGRPRRARGRVQRWQGHVCLLPPQGPKLGPPKARPDLLGPSPLSSPRPYPHAHLLTSPLPRTQLGEGVPDQRKGLFPTHTAAVSAQLRGAHVTIQARSDADVARSHILKRVSDSSGARYGVHNEPAQPYRAPAPVGSTYVPVGRPDFTPSKPVAPPTPVGTAYAPRANELADLRAAGAAKAAAPPPAPRALPGLTAGSAGLRVAEPTTKPAPPPASNDDDDDFAPQVNKAPSFAAARAPPPPSAPAPSSTSTSASTASQAASERPAAVGTSYTPVSLPKPGKLGNRWQAAVSGANSDAAESPAASPSPAKSSSAGAGAAKPLTWSQRQEQARLEREKDDAASASAFSSPSPAVKAAGAAIGGTAAVGLAAGAALGVGAGLAGAAAVGVGAAAVKSAVESRDEDEEKAEQDEDGFDAPPPAPPAPPALSARSEPEPEPEREVEVRPSLLPSASRPSPPPPPQALTHPSLARRAPPQPSPRSRSRPATRRARSRRAPPRRASARAPCSTTTPRRRTSSGSPRATCSSASSRSTRGGGRPRTPRARGACSLVRRAARSSSLTLSLDRCGSH